MPAYTQANRLLSFNSPLGANTLIALGFEGVEEMSQLFDYTADVVTEPETVVSPSALVGKRVTMELLVSRSGDKRYFNGIVASFSTIGGDNLFNRYHIRMVPLLWLLSLNEQTRVFQDLSVLDIARKVLEPYSIALKMQVEQSYPTLEYCTQYRETDLQFFTRILQRHGIFFYFTHTASDHVLVLSDTSQLCSECPVDSELYFVTPDVIKLNVQKSRVVQFRSRSTLIPGEHTSWDYRFIPYAVSHAAPATARSNVEMGENSHELYDFADSAASFFKTEGADAQVPRMQTVLQNAQRDASDATAIVCEGDSTALTLQAGFTFTLHDYPQSDKNIKYLATRVTHRIYQQPVYRSELARPADADPYTNTFEARPFQQVYRAAVSLAKPRVHGVVTGKVVTFPGEDSYLDRFGRVCVQFWWDRTRPPQTPDKTLLRVAQQWAGKGWGTYFWPRIGDEVLIDFIEGDPDAPIVVGSVYNGINMPKYDPKSEYTRSGILTRSSVGGGPTNANELRFEDRMGSEQIFLNAERDMDHRTEQSHRRYVGAKDSLYVKDDRLEQIGGSQETSVEQNRVEHIGGHADLSVATSRTETAGENYALKVGMNHAVDVGMMYSLNAKMLCSLQGEAGVVLESKTMICLKVADTMLMITPLGVFASTPVVPLPAPVATAAMAALPPMPALPDTPATPTAPDIADDGTRGGKMNG